MLNDDNRGDTEANDINHWLINRRQQFVGDKKFVPKSYFALGKFRGILEDEEFLKGQRYGMLRLLALKSQGRSVLWTKYTDLSSHLVRLLTEEEQVMIEKKWRRIVEKITNKEMGLLDFLLLEPNNYQIEKESLIAMIRHACHILAKL